MDEKPELLEMTADIVSAYVGNNTVSAETLPSLIANIHAALSQVTTGAVEPEPEPKEPAVPIRKSIAPDYLICLEDGRKFKSLKRHLRTKYDMSPEEYSTKWGLPKDYPMVAPNYAKARSELAKSMGLGQGGRKPARAAGTTIRRPMMPPTRQTATVIQYGNPVHHPIITRPGSTKMIADNVPAADAIVWTMLFSSTECPLK